MPAPYSDSEGGGGEDGGGGDSDKGGEGGGSGGSEGGDGGWNCTTKDFAPCLPFAREKLCPKPGAAHSAPFQPSPYESVMSRVHVAPSATANGELDVYGLPPLSVVPSEQVRLQPTSDCHDPPEQVIAEEIVEGAVGVNTDPPPRMASKGEDGDVKVFSLSPGNATHVGGVRRSNVQPIRVCLYCTGSLRSRIVGKVKAIRVTFPIPTSMFSTAYSPNGEFASVVTPVQSER